LPGGGQFTVRGTATLIGAFGSGAPPGGEGRREVAARHRIGAGPAIGSVHVVDAPMRTSPTSSPSSARGPAGHYGRSMGRRGAGHGSMGPPARCRSGRDRLAANRRRRLRAVPPPGGRTRSERPDERRRAPHRELPAAGQPARPGKPGTLSTPGSTARSRGADSGRNPQGVIAGMRTRTTIGSAVACCSARTAAGRPARSRWSSLAACSRHNATTVRDPPVAPLPIRFWPFGRRCDVRTAKSV